MARPATAKAVPRVMKSIPLKVPDLIRTERAARKAKMSWTSYARMALMERVASDLGDAA